MAKSIRIEEILLQIAPQRQGTSLAHVHYYW
jgi:hypothetical protein